MQFPSESVQEAIKALKIRRALAFSTEMEAENEGIAHWSGEAIDPAGKIPMNLYHCSNFHPACNVQKYTLDAASLKCLKNELELAHIPSTWKDELASKLKTVTPQVQQLEMQNGLRTENISVELRQNYVLKVRGSCIPELEVVLEFFQEKGRAITIT